MQSSRDTDYQRPGVGTLMYMGGDDPVAEAEKARARAFTPFITGGAALWALGGSFGIPKKVRTGGGIIALALFLAI